MLQPRLAGLGHDVVGADLPGRGGDVDLDCTDHTAVDAAVEQVRPDAVIHLAGISTESSLPDALISHVVSTGALLEAMVRHDVRRIVYASSNHAVGREPRSDLLAHDVRGRPDTFYGVGKVAAEALLQLFVDRHGIDVVSTRIGTFAERPTIPAPARQLALPRRRSADVPGRADRADPGFAVVYGTSANTRGWWDLAPGRALGYEPQDDAEQYAAEIEAAPETEADRAEAAHVGGPFATRAEERPAFD